LTVCFKFVLRIHRDTEGTLTYFQAIWALSQVENIYLDVISNAAVGKVAQHVKMMRAGHEEMCAVSFDVVTVSSARNGFHSAWKKHTLSRWRPGAPARRGA
jgi:hypothetical protein